MEISSDAVLAQLVEHDLAKVGVTSSSLVYRSKLKAISVQYNEHDLDHNSRGYELFLVSCTAQNFSLRSKTKSDNAMRY